MFKFQFIKSLKRDVPALQLGFDRGNTNFSNSAFKGCISFHQIIEHRTSTNNDQFTIVLTAHHLTEIRYRRDKVRLSFDFSKSSMTTANCSCSAKAATSCTRQLSASCFKSPTD